MTKAPRNIGASVQARLAKLARERGEDAQRVYLQYANERLLYRLGASRHASRFVLKGAALFTVWTNRPHRTTRDIDLLGVGESSEAHLHKTFTEVLALAVLDDGVVFDAASVEAGPIREDQEYGGVRLTFTGSVGTARVKLQVDVGFGDVVTPGTERLAYPPLLDFPGPNLLAYPRETVVAEKLEAVVKLGIANSRMKDFYDLVVLSRMFEFDGQVLVQALRATFRRRGTELPASMPIALTDAFSEDPTKRTQWSAFVRKSGTSDAGTLSEAIAVIRQFAVRPLEEAGRGRDWNARWSAGGRWTEEA